MERNEVTYCALSIQTIIQKDNHMFSILWNDGLKQNFRLNDLQQACPCAGCQNKDIKEILDVRARKINSVGRYAIRIHFTSGCSQGIYTFDLLRQLGKAEA